MGSFLQQAEISKYTSLLEILNSISTCTSEEEIFRKCLNQAKWVIDFHSLDVVFLEPGSSSVQYFQVMGAKEIRPVKSYRTSMIEFLEESREVNQILSRRDHCRLFEEAASHGLVKDAINQVLATKIFEEKALTEIILFGSRDENGFSKNDRILLSILASIISGSTSRIRSSRELIKKNERLEALFAETEEMREKLLSQERLAFIGSVSAGIAHEIKNPLNLIALSRSVMKKDAEKIYQYCKLSYEKENEEFENSSIKKKLDRLLVSISTVESQGSRAARILNSILTSAYADRGENEGTRKMDVSELILQNMRIAFQSSKEAMSPHMDNLVLEENLDKEEAKLTIFPIGLSKVFISLFENALAAMDRKCRNGDLECYTPHLKLESFSRDKRYIITITDNGEGVSEDCIHRVFDPFYTTKEAGQGTGLGLFVAKNTILKHGGEIHIDSKLGEYTRLTISLLNSDEKEKERSLKDAS